MTLPIKKVYDHRLNKVKEVTKLPKEFKLNNDEVLFKIKLVGMNYCRDFESLKSLPNDIVPGNKIVGKVHSCNENFNYEYFDEISNNKYIIFPYSNCAQQNITLCANCQKNQQLPCLRKLEYGLTLDGGLQDFIKIPNFNQIAIKVPHNISSHDVMFLLDIALPFYVCIKNYFGPRIDQFNGNNKALVILNDCEAELNDILLVMKLVNLNEQAVDILDVAAIKSFSEQDRQQYHFKYEHVFVFSLDPTIIGFAMQTSMALGLQACKTRYHLILFYQYTNQNVMDFISDEDFNDKIVVQFHLHWFNKGDFVELLEYVSSLNDSSKPISSSVAPNSIVRSRSSFGTISSDISSHKSLDYPSPPLSNKPSKPQDKNRWLWYDKDYDTIDIKQVNKLIRNNTFTRVCYKNRKARDGLNVLVLGE